MLTTDLFVQSRSRSATCIDLSDIRCSAEWPQRAMSNYVLHCVFHIPPCYAHGSGVIVQLAEPDPEPDPITMTWSVVPWAVSDRGGQPGPIRCARPRGGPQRPGVAHKGPAHKGPPRPTKARPTMAPQGPGPQGAHTGQARKGPGGPIRAPTRARGGPQGPGPQGLRRPTRAWPASAQGGPQGRQGPAHNCPGDRCIVAGP